jgi:hypothetical protein
MDCVLEYMRANGIEINRQNYLDLADLGDVPELDGEVESMLPPEIQKMAKTKRKARQKP